MVLTFEAPALLNFFAGEWSEAPDDETQGFSFSLDRHGKYCQVAALMPSAQGDAPVQSFGSSKE